MSNEPSVTRPVFSTDLSGVSQRSSDIYSGLVTIDSRLGDVLDSVVIRAEEDAFLREQEEAIPAWLPRQIALQDNCISIISKILDKVDTIEQFIGKGPPRA